MGHAIFWRVSAGCSYVEHVHLMCVHEVGMVMTKSADWHTTRPGSGIYIQEWWVVQSYFLLCELCKLFNDSTLTLSIFLM